MPARKVKIGISDLRKPYNERVVKDIGVIVYDHPCFPPLRPSKTDHHQSITFTLVPTEIGDMKRLYGI